MASNLQADFSLTEANELFKTDFKEYAEAVYNNDMLLWSQIDKPQMQGKLTEFPVPFGYQGGRGFGSLPEANVAQYETVSFTNERAYAVSRVEREAIHLSLTSKGAFVRAMQETVDKTIEAFEWMMSFVLYGTGDGALGDIAAGGVTDNGGGNYSLVIDSMKNANFEVRDLVNIGTTNTDKFEIESVTTSTSTIVVQRQSGGTDVPAPADTIFLQGSENEAPEGLKGVIDATSGTKYGVSVGGRWESTKDAAGGAAIDNTRINDLLLDIEEKVGKKNSTNMIVTSYTQMAKLMNQLEDQKRYNLVTRMPLEGLKGAVGFSGIQIMTPKGPVEAFPEKFVEDDRMYFLNTDFIKAYTAGKTGWATEDGTTYLRVADEDTYEARYVWYGQIYIAPTYQGVITGLSTA